MTGEMKSEKIFEKCCVSSDRCEIPLACSLECGCGLYHSKINYWRIKFGWYIRICPKVFWHWLNVLGCKLLMIDIRLISEWVRESFSHLKKSRKKRYKLPNFRFLKGRSRQDSDTSPSLRSPQTQSSDFPRTTKLTQLCNEAWTAVDHWSTVMLVNRMFSKSCNVFRESASVRERQLKKFLTRLPSWVIAGQTQDFCF